MKSFRDIDWEAGTFQETIPWQSEFVNYLRTIGINAACMAYHDTNYLSLYVYSLDDVLQARVILSQPGYEDAMIDKFFELAEESGYEFGERSRRDLWQTGHLNYIASFELRCMFNTVYTCKEEVFSLLKRELFLSPPKYVFCHSSSEETSGGSTLPGYVLIFDSPEMAAEIKKSEREKITKLIKEVLKRHDKTGYCMKYEPDVTIDDITSKNMYGYSRED